MITKIEVHFTVSFSLAVHRYQRAANLEEQYRPYARAIQYAATTILSNTINKNKDADMCQSSETCMIWLYRSKIRSLNLVHVDLLTVHWFLSALLKCQS